MIRWVCVAVAALVVGATMSKFAPDPARRVTSIEAKVAELERLVRSNAKHSHNMRDLKDGNLFDAADGQVPKYDETLGQYRPGTAGGDLFVAYGSATTQSIPGGTLTVVQYDTVVVDASWASPHANGPGNWTLETGQYILAGSVSYTGPAVAGWRSIYLEHSGGISSEAQASRATWDRIHVSTTDGIHRATSVPFEVTNADNVVAVYAEQTGQASLDIQLRTDYTYIRIMKLG